MRLASRSADLTRYTNEVTLVVIFGTGAAFLIALMVNVLLAREAAVQTRLAAERDEAVDALLASNEELQTTSEKLLQQERSFRALAETMPQLVWSTNASGANEYFNGRWREYAGTTDTSAGTGEWRDSLHPIRHRRGQREMESLLPHGRAVRGGESPAPQFRWILSLVSLPRAAASR